MLYDRIALEKHIYVATRAERIQNSKHWILTINAEGPQQPLNQRPDFAQAKRECKRLHDEHLARTQEQYRTIPRSQQIRQRRGQQFEGNEETTRLTLKQVGGSTKGRGETCRQLRQDRGPTCKQLRHRRQIGTKPIGRRAIGLLSILPALATAGFFLRVRPVSVAWSKTSSQPTGDVNCTRGNTARTELHSMITFHHANTRGSRAGRLRIAHLCVLKMIVIHVSCLFPCRT